MAPGYIIFLLARLCHIKKKKKPTPPFSLSTAQIQHNPGWSVTAAAFLCHASQSVSIIILWCQRGAQLREVGLGWGGRLEGFFCCCCFPFFQDPVEETKLRVGAERFLAPVWSRDNICRSPSLLHRSLLVTLCVGRNRGYKLPTVTVSGPRLVGVAWEELLQPWSPLVCIAAPPLSRRLPCSPG